MTPLVVLWLASGSDWSKLGGSSPDLGGSRCLGSGIPASRKSKIKQDGFGRIPHSVFDSRKNTQTAVVLIGFENSFSRSTRE
jgi:hypothetical protein